jgi:hypothetical protein
VTEDEVNGNRCYNGREAAGDPMVFPHDPHRDTNKESETDRKTQERQKEEGNKDNDQHMETQLCSWLEECPYFDVFFEDVDDDKDGTANKNHSHP